MCSSEKSECGDIRNCRREVDQCHGRSEEKGGRGAGYFGGTIRRQGTAAVNPMSSRERKAYETAGELQTQMQVARLRSINHVVQPVSKHKQQPGSNTEVRREYAADVADGASKRLRGVEEVGAANDCRKIECIDQCDRDDGDQQPNHKGARLGQDRQNGRHLSWRINCFRHYVVAMTAEPLDLLDEALWQRNPHDVWSWMRENDPVYHDAANGLWAVTRHADVLAVERNAVAFPSDHSYRAIPSFDESNMIAQDDPGHKAQRMLVQRFFAPGVIAKRADEIRETVRSLLRETSSGVASGERFSFEVIDALAGRLPALLTAHLMGFEESDWPKLKTWSERLMRTDSRERIPGVMEEFIGANMSLFAAVEERILAKRANPADDLFTVWSHANVGGEPMSSRAIMHEAGLFVSGGAETTRTTIAHGLRAFVDHPEQWEALAVDPSLVSGAVEEVLRWVTPLNNFFRVSRGDNRVGDVVIPDGERAILVYPSANRDDAVFRDPFTFDISRTPNHHISFGNGPHTCIGAPLARLSLRIVFEECSRMFTSLSVESEPEVEANLFARAVKRFELSATVR